MSRAIDRRVKALEVEIEPSQVHWVIRFHNPDGSITYLPREAPAPTGGCEFINILPCVAIEGRPAINDELEGMFPGRTERIARGEHGEGQWAV